MREAPQVDPAASKKVATASNLLEYLHQLEQLSQGAPAEQAEIFANAQREFDAAPTPTHKLHLALILAQPGHPATDLLKARQLLSELVANPQGVAPDEHSIAFIWQQRVENDLSYEEKTKKLVSDAQRADKERVAAASHRAQLEVDYKKLKDKLDEDEKKLAAITEIEHNLDDRKPRKPSTEKRSSDETSANKPSTDIPSTEGRPQ